MSTLISLSNSKKDVKNIDDPIKRAFVPKLIKSFNPLLSNYFESLKNISSQLAKFDPTTTKKESYLLFTDTRFHYFEQYKKYFQFGKGIYDDCFRILSKHIHFRFAQVASQQIVSKVQTLVAKKDTKPGQQLVEQFNQTFKVLGDTGVLLELNYKLVHVKLDLQAKTRNWSYVTREKEEKIQSVDGKIHFVGIFFGIAAIYLPQSQSETKIQIKQGLKALEKDIQYISLKMELMKFIGVKKSSTYYLVFHKFHLLHRLKYREYSDKYLTQASVKEGFFGSIGDFFKGAAGTIANGVTKAVSAASNVVDFYQKNIKPAVDILTPIVSPYLPDSISSLLKNELGVKQNAQLDSQQKKDEEQLQKVAKQLATNTKKSVEQCTDFLHGKAKFKKFQSDLKKQQAKQIGLDLLPIRSFNFIGMVNIQNRKAKYTKDYIAFPYDNQTIITQSIQIKQGDRATFYLGNNIPFELITYLGKFSYFKTKDEIPSLSKARFKIDLKQNYSSDECLYQSLVNKTIYLVGFDQKSNDLDIKIEASKIIRCYRNEFYELFKKQYPGFIFYIDQQPNTYKVISFFDGSKKQDFEQLLNIDKTESSLIGSQNINEVLKTLKNCSSKFLEYKDFAELMVNSKKELNIFVGGDDQKGGDDNADGESLKTQLINNKITKSSPLELIGFIHIENQRQSRFGVGLLVKDKQLQCFMTLKQNVLYDGVGYVGVRKPQADQEGPDTFSLLDFQQDQKYQFFEITHIVPYDGFEDYVFVMINNSLQAPKPKTHRQLNTLSSSIAKNTSLYGGFYVEFDLSKVQETKKITVSYRELLEVEQSSYQMNVTSKFPEKQGIFFAYKKEKPNRQSFLGFYSSKQQKRIISPLQNTKEMIVFTPVFTSFFDVDKTSAQLREISKLRRPLEGQLNKFQAIGVLDGSSSSSASFVSVDGIKNVDGIKKTKYILAAAHHFLKANKDLREKYQTLNFKYPQGYTTIFKKFTRIKLVGAELFIHPQYQQIINKIRDSKDPDFDSDDETDKPTDLYIRKREFDIAVIKLKDQVQLQNPMIFSTNNGKSWKEEDLIKQSLDIFNDTNDESYFDLCIAGYPADFSDPPNTKTQLEKGYLYYETVQDHKSQHLTQSVIDPIQIDIKANKEIDPDQDKPIVEQEDYTAYLLSYLLSSHSGMSGAPIFNLKTYKQIGVHGGGRRNKGEVINYGCYFYNPKVYNFLFEKLTSNK